MIVGTATFGSVESLGGATAAIFDLRQAQLLTGKQGRLDSILVRARDGVAPAELRQAIVACCRADLQVESAASQDRFGLDGLKEGLNIIQKFLVAFGLIALFVGGFVIFNTLAITVAQRSRDFALLRTIGASRRQVLGSVVLEAVVTGLVASVVGVAVGLGLTEGVSAAFKALDVELPENDTVLATRTLVVSLLFGVGVTTLAGLIPAVRATRVEPVAALREGAIPTSRGSRRTPIAGAVLSAIAVAALVYGMFAGGVSVGGRLAAIGVGTLILFVGVAMLSSRLVPPLASVVGRPAERIARCGRPAGTRERDAEPGSHGRDRRGADDRHRAGHVRRHPRPGTARFVLRRRGTSSSARTTWSPRRTAGRRSRARPLVRWRRRQASGPSRPFVRTRPVPSATSGP